MRIQVNGEYREVAHETTLGDLIALFSFASDRIAIEHNGVVVRRIDWSTVRLEEGDRVEIVHFVGGGFWKFELS
ncbi:MAG TPA: sulfur carrier protein ThiS [Pyrinomonadaceae bacterium]|nr:sulfur carrier protein ThiS [Pyrinomonadaceae bacterium]